MGVLYWSPSLSYASWVPAAAGAEGGGEGQRKLYTLEARNQGVILSLWEPLRRGTRPSD